MGKVKQGKRISAHRTTGDPIGAKVPLADEIESLKLAKSKSSEVLNKNQNSTSGALMRKRQAEEDEVRFHLSAIIGIYISGGIFRLFGVKEVLF